MATAAIKYLVMVSFLYGSILGATTLSPEECQNLLADRALAVRAHLLPIGQLPLALAGRDQATILVRHNYNVAPGRFIAPLAFVAQNKTLYAPDLLISVGSELFTVLRGSTKDLLEHARRMTTQHDPSEFSFELIGDALAPRWPRESTMRQLDGGEVSQLLAELDAEGVRTAMIYDADHDKGLFVFPAGALGDDADARALGITVVPELDRATFSTRARLWRSGAHAVISQPAFKLLSSFEASLSPKIPLSPEFKAMVEYCFATRNDEATEPTEGPVVETEAAAPVVTTVPPVEPAAETTLPPGGDDVIDVAEIVDAPSEVAPPDPAWIRELGPDAPAAAIVRAFVTNDHVRPARSPSRGLYAQTRLSECWAEFRPGLTPPSMEKVNASAAKNILYGKTLAMEVEVERQWNAFYHARPTSAKIEDAPVKEEGPTKEVVAPAVRLAAIRAVLAHAAGGEISAANIKKMTLRALVNLELFVPPEQFAGALKMAKAIATEGDEASQFDAAWEAFTAMLGVDAEVGARETETVMSLVRDAEVRIAAQRPSATGPVLQAPPALEMTTLKIPPAHMKRMLEQWHQIRVPASDVGKFDYTLLFRRPTHLDVDEDYVKPVVAYLNRNTVTKLSINKTTVQTFYAEAARALNFSAFVIHPGRASSVTEKKIVITPAMQLKAWLERRIDLSTIARVIRRGTVYEKPANFARIIGDVDGPKYALDFRVIEDGSLELTSIANHAARK